MPTHITILFGLVMLTAGCATHDERAIWEQRIQKVHVGMRRAEVEKLLPQYVAPITKSTVFLPYGDGMTLIHGSSQVVSYYVSPGWRVWVPYDYTGVPRDAAGRVTDVLTSPDNRVIGAVTLKYLPAPAIPTAPKKP